MIDCHSSNITKLKKQKKKQGVCHTLALLFTLKSIFKPKKKALWKLKYFTMQKHNLQKILKQTKILQDSITLL